MPNYFASTENLNQPHRSILCIRLTEQQTSVKAADRNVELCGCNKGRTRVAGPDLRTIASREAKQTFFASASFESSPGPRAKSPSSAHPYQVHGAMTASAMTAA